MKGIVILHRQPLRHKVVSKGNTSPLLTRGSKMKLFDIDKKKIVKFVIQTVINILAAALTALGTTSCVV